jgi:hypothetical protein
MRDKNRPFEIMGVEELREYVPFELSDRFGFRKDKGLHWLQRACLWVLRKIGCNAFGEELKVTRQLIKPKGVADALMQQKHVADHVFDAPHKIHRVCLGPAQYREMMHEPWVAGYANFLAYAHGGLDGKPMLFGLEVTVVPWMDGVLVLPH